MSDIHQLEEWLQEEQGFKPVARSEIECVETAVKENVAEPVFNKLTEQQDDLAKARTWCLR